MAKILVTGSRGSLGRPLVRALTQAGHEVWETDQMHAPGERYVRADVASYRQLAHLFEQEYDLVFHLAAEFGRKNGEEYYESLWTSNVIGTRHILEWQLKRGFKLIFMSSSEIYGEIDSEWLDETLPERHSVVQHNEYALTKWVNEVQIMNFERRYGSPIMRMRLFNSYGPGEYFHAYRSVVCLFIYRALHGLPYTVYLDHHRVFMYIDDLIPTLVRSVSAFRAGEVYNIGGSEYRSVLDLSDLVLAHTGADPRLARHVRREEHNRLNKRPNITKALRDLGHRPVVGLEEGVPRTIAWMKQVYGGRV